MYRALVLVVLLLCVVDGFDLSSFLRRLRPGRNRILRHKRPELSVPFKGKMKWDNKQISTSMDKTKASRPATTPAFTLSTTAATISETIDTTAASTAAKTTILKKTSANSETSAGKSYTRLVYTNCQEAFLPEFVAILANSSMGQVVLENLKSQGLITFYESNADSELITSPNPHTSEEKYFSELVYTGCQEAFLPEFVAVLSNSSMGQIVLEKLQQQGLITFKESIALAG